MDMTDNHVGILGEIHMAIHMEKLVGNDQEVTIVVLEYKVGVMTDFVVGTLVDRYTTVSFGMCCIASSSIACLYLRG